MPLLDHFHDVRREANWRSFHGMWPGCITQRLNAFLPLRYFAQPTVQNGSIEVDAGTWDHTPFEPWASDDSGGGVATMPWTTPQTALLDAEWPELPEYSVHIYDHKTGDALVAAIELVSPANKDRPAHRDAFVQKCVSLLMQGVSVTIVDIVTERHDNIYGELQEALSTRRTPVSKVPLYAVAVRGVGEPEAWKLETAEFNLSIGEPLPTLPLWLNEGLTVPLELEETYLETCRSLRIR